LFHTSVDTLFSGPCARRRQGACVADCRGHAAPCLEPR
jgi:hypothetical protein